MKNSNALLLLLTLSLIPLRSHAGWTEDWFDASAKTGSSSFKGQQRGYYSAGGFSGRFNMSSDPLLTISPPRIKAGCGGVDIFLGGLTFLDEEYMVQKLQNMAQAAPAIAFDIAMKVMSKELSDTMKSMEAIINDLNSIQMDDCALASKIAAPIGNWAGEAAASNLNMIDQKVGTTLTNFKNWYDGNEKQKTNDDKVSENTAPLVNGCPVQLKNLFKEGLLLENVASEVGMTGYQDLIRGIVGDVDLRPDPDNKIIIGIPKDGCDEQDNYSIDSFVNGDVEVMATDFTCTPDKPGGLSLLVDTMMVSVATKMQQDTAGADYTLAEKSFIETAPVPVYALLRNSIEADNVDFTVSTLSSVVAYAYAFYLVDNLYLTADKMLSEAERIINAPGSPGKDCDKTVYAQPMAEYQRLRGKLKDLRDAARVSYMKRTNESVAHIQFTQSFIANQDRLNKLKASAVTTE